MNAFWYVMNKVIQGPEDMIGRYTFLQRIFRYLYIFNTPIVIGLNWISHDTSLANIYLNTIVLTIYAITIPTVTPIAQIVAAEFA